MAYISYNKLWENEFDNIVSEKEKVQDLNIIQLKLEVHGTYKRDEKMPTKVEPVDNEDVLSKSYVDSKLSKKEVQNSYFEKDYNDFNIQYNKQSVAELLIQRAVKTTMQILHD